MSVLSFLKEIIYILVDGFTGLFECIWTRLFNSIKKSFLPTTDVFYDTK